MERQKGNALIVLLVFILLALVGIGVYYQFFLYKSPGQIINQITGGSVKLPKYFVNCSDPRQVLEDGGSLYIACLGGVIKYDKATGEVKDQIAMPEGLGNVIATSLVKDGNKLYAGSQDGFTVFDLTSRSAQKISVKEGLTNGANIELFQDGKNIWVITFDGINLYNTETSQIIRYTREQLDPGANKVNVVNAYLDEKYVYFLEVASVESSGAVIRYDRTNKTFKTFKPDSFGETGQYARIDFNSIGAFGNHILVSESNSMFAIDENGDDTWKKITSPYDFVAKDTGSTSVLIRVSSNPYKDGVLLFSENKLYSYDPSTDTTKVVYSFGKEFAQPLFRNSGDKIWFIQNAASGNLISALDLSLLQVTNYEFKDRPLNFGSLVSVIDDNAILQTINGIYKYSLSENKFTKISGPDVVFLQNFSATSFEPVAGSPDILILNQECGQGCAVPKPYLYNYSTNTSTPLTIPANVLSVVSRQAFGGGTMYDSLQVNWKDEAKGEYGMEYQKEGTLKYIVFNYSDKSWSLMDSIPQGAVNLNASPGVTCNQVYSFTGGKFSSDGCTGKAENNSYSWTIKEDVITEKNKSNNAAKVLNPPSLEAPYSPFENFYKPRFGPIMYAEGKLWILSNLGLDAYDSAAGTYKTYGPKDGLLGPSINQFLVTKYVWVITDGGFSIINP